VKAGSFFWHQIFVEIGKDIVMKTLAFYVAALLLVACGPADKDSVKQAHDQNLNSSIDEEVSEFLTEAADARMMDLEQGKLASTKGGTAEVRQYGQWMVKDQTRMLTELRVLAASKNIVLPNDLSHKKANALDDLKEKSGEEFDKKFIDMMRIDHKRDVDEFEDALEFRDPDIKQYAQTYLPVVKSHLEKIEAINESSGVAEKAEIEN
jgi:putative membrane protein